MDLIKVRTVNSEMFVAVFIIAKQHCDGISFVKMEISI